MQNYIATRHNLATIARHDARVGRTAQPAQTAQTAQTTGAHQMAQQPQAKPLTRRDLDEILATQGYAAAKAAADKANIIWFASAGATRKPQE